MLNVNAHESLAIRIKITMGVLKAWPCRWLMVFNNDLGRDAKSGIRNYMPESEQGAYLITRNFEEARQRKVVRLPDLGLLDVVELLMMRSGAERSDENYEQGIKLVKKLEKIPRLVMQVGLYIRKSKISFAELVERGDEPLSARPFVLSKLRQGPVKA